jgi:SAM domain (Sterile alpha motif)
MQQIADWLEKLGMSEYAQRFTENGISVAALRHLTDQDLKDIGVLLGHRARQPGFPDDPSAQCRRGIAPKNIATFNTHTEAPEPMVGALWTSYDASFPVQMGGGDEKALPSTRQTS